LLTGLSALVSDGQADYAYLSPGAGQAPLAAYNQTGVAPIQWRDDHWVV
jgi:hypothetical protein